MQQELTVTQFNFRKFNQKIVTSYKFQLLMKFIILHNHNLLAERKCNENMKMATNFILGKFKWAFSKSYFRSEEVTFYPSNPDNEGGLGVVFIIVISVVSILFVVLIITCVSYQCLMRARRYKNVPDYESGTTPLAKIRK